jgi:DNA-directed RNA polymerase II subunit RPB2
MTVGQPIEGVVNKVCAVKGTVADATPFNGTAVETFMNELEALGYERHGNESLYNGFTGEMIETAIFVCPIHYQRLKHIVDNKIHSRDNTGPIQMLTKQPAEGRARDGGHRIGEMERDAMLGHGVMKFLKERFHECSDAHSMWVCSKCGLPAIVNEQLGKYQCRMCVSPELRRIEVPYATKLMGQEVATMNIIMKTFTEQ